MTGSGSRQQLETSIRTVSGLMTRLLGAVVLLYPALIALYAFGGGALRLSHPWIVARGLTAADFSLGFSAALFVALAFGAAPLVWGLWRLQRMFGSFAAGKVFAVETIGEFERFAWALAVAALATPLGSAILGALLRLGGVPAEPSVSVSVSSTDAVMLLMSVVLGVVAKVMHMAAHLAAENAEYV